MDLHCDEKIDFNQLIAAHQATKQKVKQEVEKKIMEGLEDYSKETTDDNFSLQEENEKLRRLLADYQNNINYLYSQLFGSYEEIEELKDEIIGYQNEINKKYQYTRNEHFTRRGRRVIKRKRNDYEYNY